MRLCVGKDCRHAKGHDKLRDVLLDAGVDLVGVRCQNICKGPVIGVKLKGELHWFSKLRGGEHRKHVVRLLANHKPGHLKQHEVKKRRGKLRD